MTPAGETLRRERLRLHLELDQISNELKISSRMLDAIENEKFDRLPGGVFARSFVRQYARLLGLDEDELAAQAQQMIEPTAIPSHFALPPRENGEPPIFVPRVEAWEDYEEKRFQWNSWMPAAAMVIIAMLACSGVYNWWQRSKRVIAARELAPAAQFAQAPSPEPIAQPAVEPPAVPAAPAPAETAPQAQAQVVPAQVVPPSPAESSSPVRVAMTAEEPVWISARADGKYLFSGVLSANQTRTVEANDTLLLRTGNAGGLTITLNGKPVGVLGPKGQVRTVQFTPGGFQIVAAPKPSLPL